jgi:hypothetical protein
VRPACFARAAEGAAQHATASASKTTIRPRGAPRMDPPSIVVRQR